MIVVVSANVWHYALSANDMLSGALNTTLIAPLSATQLRQLPVVLPGLFVYWTWDGCLRYRLFVK